MVDGIWQAPCEKMKSEDIPLSQPLISNRAFENKRRNVNSKMPFVPSPPGERTEFPENETRPSNDKVPFPLINPPENCPFFSDVDPFKQNSPDS